MSEIKNLKKAAQRIKKAIKKHERIILYGDADLDGTTATILLEETIKNLGGRVFLKYFPDREIEGYGLSRNALDFLSEQTPVLSRTTPSPSGRGVVRALPRTTEGHGRKPVDECGKTSKGNTQSHRREPVVRGLLITLDCGIGNFEELKLAKKLGFETIVIDHHEILQRIPSSSLVVDPKQKGDNYPLKKLATVGIVYRLSTLLLPHKLSSVLNQSFLQLAALGTLADMMPEEGYNQVLVEEGLESLFSTFRPSIRVLLEMVTKREDLPRTAVQKLIPILNITDIKNHLTESYILLTSVSEEGVRDLVKKLLLNSQQRSLYVKEISEDIEAELAEDSNNFVFQGSPEWPHFLTGSVASRICRRLHKPAFIFKIGKELSRGSVRTTQGINGVEALESCNSLLEMYGGHPPAAGFTVKNENIEKLRECLAEYFNK